MNTPVKMPQTKLDPEEHGYATAQEAYEDLLRYLDGPVDYSLLPKEARPPLQVFIVGENGIPLQHKTMIPLRYASSGDESIIYLQDLTIGKQLTKDCSLGEFKLFLADSLLIIDFDKDYYYCLEDFDNRKQYSYVRRFKKLGVGLLNESKKKAVAEWIRSVTIL